MLTVQYCAFLASCSAIIDLVLTYGIAFCISYLLPVSRESNKKTLHKFDNECREVSVMTGPVITYCIECKFF